MSTRGPHVRDRPRRRQGVHQGQRRVLQAVRRAPRRTAPARQVAEGLGDDGDSLRSPRSPTSTEALQRRARLQHGKLANDGRDDVQRHRRSSRSGTRRRAASSTSRRPASRTRSRSSAAGRVSRARSRSTTGTSRCRLTAPKGAVDISQVRRLAVSRAVRRARPRRRAARRRSRTRATRRSTSPRSI